MKPKKTICLIVGTRPEAIKLAPVYFALRNSSELVPLLLSTGQHREMLRQTFASFGIIPDVDLDIMKSNQGLAELSASILSRTHEILKEISPAAIVVQGDTTTVLSASLAAFYAGIPVGHVEAGLRSGDMTSPWPEEMNRKLVSSLCRWHFCPTPLSRDNLTRENFDPAHCHITGNTVIDALLWIKERQQSSGLSARDICQQLQIPSHFQDRFFQNERHPWVLVTGHRRESFGAGFENICLALKQIAAEHPDTGIIYPVHLNPNVREPVHRILSSQDNILLIEPVAYENFVWLMDRCHFILTDSGGIQEEAPSLGKPVLIMRSTTERPEGITAGTSRLVGTNTGKIVEESNLLLADKPEYLRRCNLANPYGDGSASMRIVNILERDLGREAGSDQVTQ